MADRRLVARCGLASGLVVWLGVLITELWIHPTMTGETATLVTNIPAKFPLRGSTEATKWQAEPRHRRRWRTPTQPRHTAPSRRPAVASSAPTTTTPGPGTPRMLFATPPTRFAGSTMSAP